ncbi:MAG TPA: glycosyltransferase [Rubrivivax sp.]|nr:glycosyltransferase [Rubrivivax sp.]
MSPPLISVALATYNGERHLQAQLDSLRTQNWPHLEIVAIDDASTDGSWAMLQQAAAADGRLRIVRNDRNLGSAATFERAMAMCRGDYIAPSDQDDVWHADKLQTLVAAIDGHTLAYADSALIDDSGAPLGLRLSDRFGMAQGSDPLAFAFWNSVSGHAMLLRRELLRTALPLRGGRFHDWWLAFVAASTGSIVYVPRQLVDYRQHAQSQTDIAGRRRRRRTHEQIAAKYDERLQWFAALAQFPSPHQPQLRCLHTLWQQRGSAWFCPALWRFLHANEARLLASSRDTSIARFAAKQFLGMRWRQLGRGAVMHPRAQ